MLDVASTIEQLLNKSLGGRTNQVSLVVQVRRGEYRVSDLLNLCGGLSIDGENGLEPFSRDRFIIPGRNVSTKECTCL